MKLLLNDEFAPITRQIGFLQADHQAIASAFLGWMAEGIRKDEVHHQRPVEGSIRDVLSSLLPLSDHRRRFVMVPTASSWTAYFDNGWKGTDSMSWVSYMSAKRLMCRGVRIVAQPKTLRGEGKDEQGSMGSLIFEVFGPEKPDWFSVIRSIGVINYWGRWKFETGGTPLPFEKSEHYQAKRVRDRFPEALFHEYLAALDLYPFDEDFYTPPDKPPAILNERALFPNEQENLYSLDDMRWYV